MRHIIVCYFNVEQQINDADGAGHQRGALIATGAGARRQGTESEAERRGSFGCGQMGSTLMGPLQNNEFRQIGEKGTPWHFWEDHSRLTGVPKKSLCQQKHESCSDPISADPFCPFPSHGDEGRTQREGGGTRGKATGKVASRGQDIVRATISKGIRRQGIGSFIRNSYVSTLCPVVMCPYVCTSDLGQPGHQGKSRRGSWFAGRSRSFTGSRDPKSSPVTQLWALGNPCETRLD